MERWQFIESPNGGWYWIASDVLSRRTRTSAATFQSRPECVADALKFGYGKVAGAGMPAAVSKHAPRARRHKRG
jgi:hypothetical protein